tara:strand:- start:710 stop:1447 length:738 start_codon:yes stop_codon:yes gene_type:complete
MKNISDYDFSRVSAFIDGELNADEINCLITDMQTKPELKELYFSLLEISEVSESLRPLGFKERLSKLSLQDLIAAFTQRVVMPMTIFSVGALLSYSILNNALFINDNENRASILLNQSIASSEAKQILENIKSDEILQFASRHYVPDNSRNIVPVAYQPNWLPRGFNSDRKIQNRFINKTDKKQFSIFIDKPTNFNLPDGVYQKENFILIRKTHFHGDQPHTITIFGDIDVESGKKILNSIRTNN